MIMDKYKHLNTPIHIMDSIDNALKMDIQPTHSLNYHQYDAKLRKEGNFLKDSLKYRNEKGVKSNVIPFQSYSPTFESLDKYRKGFYFYWRKQANEGHFVDTELSYIFLFAYELINYGFNSNAAYNVSMLVQLHTNYVYRYPKLEGYLPQWIADFLLELGETSLAKEWSSSNTKEDIEYTNLKSYENKLNGINMNTWWKFIPNRTRSHFFMENKQKIYTAYKEMAGFMHWQFKEETNGLVGIIEKLYPMKETKVEREMFSSAVVSRKVRTENAIIIKRVLDEDFCLFLAELMRLAENVIRKQLSQEPLKINRMLMSEDTEQYLLEKMENNKKFERFTKVSETVSMEFGSEIPSKSETINFNYEVIESLTKESRELQTIFEEKYQEDNEEYAKIEVNISTDSTPLSIAEKNIHSIFNDKVVGENEVQQFLGSLTPIEINFLQLMKENMTIERAKFHFKQIGVMFGSFLININEKAEEHLGDTLLEECDEMLELTEEYTNILNYL